MRRAQAAFLIATLFAAPLALLARGGACGERACCAKQCCLPKVHHTATEKDGGGKMACQHHSSPVPDCAMKSACNHTLDYGFTSPLPPIVLQAAGISLPVHAARGGAFAISSTFSTGFIPTPFEPPRS